MKYHSSTRVGGCVALMIAMTAAPVALGGTLRIVPQVKESQVIVPVMLEGEISSGVAALDFYLNYDPAVLEPAGITAGNAAVSAGKQVLSNMTAPGRYKVILFGINQNLVSAGEVARVTLRMKGDAEGRTNLKVTGTHLASAEGLEMPSSGSSETLVFGDESSEDVDEEVDEESEIAEDEPETDEDGEGAPEDAGEPAATDPDAPPGPTRTATAADGTAGSASLGSGTAKPLVAGMPRTDASLKDGSEAALARLAQMRDETRQLRNGIASPGTGVNAAPETGAPLEAGSPSAPDEAAADEPGQSTTPQALDSLGAPPGAPSAARPVNQVPMESVLPPEQEGPAASWAAERGQTGVRTRVLIAAALAAMGGVAAGMLVLRRRLFS